MNYMQSFMYCMCVYLINGNTVYADDGAASAATPVRKQTGDNWINSANFKRVYIETDSWNPDSQCGFNPRCTLISVYNMYQCNMSVFPKFNK